jgi:hypothetical protein
MVAVTYGVATPAVADMVLGKKSKGFFTIVFAAIADSQMKRAKREIAMHAHLLASTDKSTDSEDMPFGGW